MSWMRKEDGSAGATAISAATASGVLEEDGRELEKVRQLGMSPRQLWLNHLWSRFCALQYDARATEWDGSESQSAVEREMMASTPTVPPGFHASPSDTPYRFRRPSAPYHLFRVVVQRFTSLLFAEARHPRVTCPGDQEKEDFANGIIETARFWTAFEEARNYGGACGGVPVAFSFVENKPVVEVLEPFYCWPKFKSRTTMELEKVEVRWMFPADERDAKGKWQTVRYWYRRIIDAESDTVWDAVRVPQDKSGEDTEPDWFAPQNEPVVSRHGFGFCPVKWIQNTKVTGQPEGEHDCTGALEMIDRMDHLLSQGLQGVDLNCDPTLKFENVGESKIPPVDKGSYAAIKVPKGTVGYMEMAGSGPKTAMEWVQALRGWVLEMCQCVLEDPDAGGVQQTATQVVKRYASMHAKAGKLREQYGQNGFLPLLEMIIRAARKLAAGRPAGEGEPAGIIRSQLQVNPKVVKQADGTQILVPRLLPVQESGALLQAVWPEWFDPSPQDALQATTAASAGVSGGLLDLEHAVKYIGPFFRVEDTALLASSLKAAKAQADQQQQDQLVQGMYQPPPPGAEQGGPIDPAAVADQPPTDW